MQNHHAINGFTISMTIFNRFLYVYQAGYPIPMQGSPRDLETKTADLETITADLETMIWKL